jgi:DNA mismatch repair protein MutL
MNIEILPEHIIDQIKAGEVLERPAALLKELIENSIDANSSEINIHLIENGLTLLSIEDNGIGIDFKNLPKAFLRHATSKLKRFEDLYNLNSYGFRGEALASLAASARVTCISQPENLHLAGGKLIIHGGKEELLTSQTIGQQGTALFIKDLFYNTPARLKFIKSKTSEKIQLKKIISSFILSHPEIQFSVKWDDKEKEFFKKFSVNDFSKRINNIFPANSTICHAIESYQNYSVNIFYTIEASRNNSQKHQFLFVNSRYFQDKTLHQAVLRNLESIWHYGESGHYVVLITSPPDAIDVNVHPNKTQIKFLDNDIIYSLLVSAIKSTLKQNVSLLPTSPHNFQAPLIGQNISQFSSIELSTTHFSESPLFHEVQDSLNIIDQEYALLKQNNIFFIVDLKLLTNNVILFHIEKTLKNEDSISPLLVSEPFKVSSVIIDKKFELTKKIGFEFDRLSSDVIILRTMPKSLPRSILNYSATAIIEFSSGLSGEFNLSAFADFLQVFKYNQIEYSIPVVNSLLELVNANNKNFLVELNKSTLGQLFK